MNKFSKKSQERLNQCHPDIQKVFTEVLKNRDCSILEGHRGKVKQNQLFSEDRSKLQWPESTHNHIPSNGIDACSYPIDWTNLISFYHFAGYVLAIADQMGIKLRWGGDWDGDQDFKDQKFNDLVHFERIP